ncbi:hypothetical protein CERZMDRAFT_100341 [Cercospora zeae-maydis SCOH1-5]|uniref:Uncharacterized protein n=1 Tax=Cercospora zeae-maydis SCOH1-5 TaxID=717836 RepID=A0A6A6F7Y5_9PEZI|nr:hypothetical protein CERZMDRAFT_100341 [Cercospora zeae-maydis SCOH1-5]
MAEHASDADVWLSRVNIAQARSQRLLQSWLPKNAAPSSTPAEGDDDDDQDNFTGLTESAGLGTKPKESDFEVDGILKKRHASSNDKLLEQLLGKKAAAAKKKEQALAKQSKSNIALGRAAPVSANGTPASAKGGLARPAVPAVDSEDEDEPGRAATFTGRKVTRDRHSPAYATRGGGARGATPIDEHATPPDPREDAATIKAMKDGISQASQEQAEAQADSARPRKKKTTSYLDELLSKKKRKKPKS